jgi:hypothetical protein
MTSKELITQLYVGYFDRAPDPEGLEFWIDVLDGGLSLEAIAIDFATQAESQNTYAYLDALIPPGPVSGGEDIEAFITAIYDNLFDRAPDAEGLAFWTAVLQNGFPAGSFILAIIDGASPADEAILANKVEVACTWVELAADDDGFVLTEDYISSSRDALGDVSGDPETVLTGKGIADLFFQDGPSVALSGMVTLLPEDTDLTERLKVANIVITDDAVGTNVLTLSGADAALFEIDGDELFLKAGTVLDFETVTTLDVAVEVDDAAFGGSPDDTAFLSITVTDVNEAASVALTNGVAAIDEDADTSVALKVADITVTDDALGTNTLSLSGDDAALFEIVGTELFLKAGTVLDFDSNGVLDVTVEVDDGDVDGSPDDSASLAISVGDTNEPPNVAVINEVAVLSEDLDTTSRVKVAEIVITDDQPGTNVLSLSGDDADLFEIDGSDLFLKAGVVLDFETNGTLDVTVDVDDADVGDSPDDSASLSITVTNVNELPEVALTNVVTTLAEDADTTAAVKVADIVLTDDGIGSNTVALTGADAGLFEIVGTEIFLKAGSALDFETNPVLDVTVTVNDSSIGDSPDDSAALSIDITDVNEAPTIALINARTVVAETEDTTDRIKIADIVLNDDGLGTNVLSLTGDDAALFEIDGTELYLKAGTDLDFDASPALDVSVEVEDADIGASPDDSAALSIIVTDSNGPPTVAVTGVPVDLPEDTDLTTRLKVGDIVVTDDIAGTNILSLTGDDATLFEIDGTELFLKAGTVLDFESDTVLDVTVVVDDTQLGTGPEDSAAVSIGVTDVNEAPTVLLNNVLVELLESTTLVTRLKVNDIVIDDDAIGTNVLSLSGADADLFEIDGDELFLKAGTALDFETNPSLDVTVEVDDAGLGATPDDSASMSVTIIDENEPPSVTLVGADTSIFEGANTTSAIEVATIQISDDAIGTNVLGLTGADAALFEIVGTSLRLKAGTVLDALANPTLDVSVTVDDAALGGSPDDSAALSITVNPGAPGLAADTTESVTFTGNASSTVRVGQIEVPDADPNTPGNQPGFVLNTDPGGTPYAGVASNALSLIDVTGLDGLLSLGVISQVDPEDFTLDNSGSAGDVEGCLGEGNVFGVDTTPSLSATGTWVFDNTGATGSMEIEIKAIDVAPGGTLDFNNVDICITGDVDLTDAVFDVDAASTIEVKAGGKLTLTVEQVDDLEDAGVIIFGEGAVCVTGESDSSDPDFNTDFGLLQAATVDLSAVTLDAGDTTLQIVASGAMSDNMGTDLVVDGTRIAQTIIGSANNDAVLVNGTASDFNSATLDVILRLGADDGDIGVPGETPSTNTPVDATPEEVGDTIIKAAGPQIQIEVDAGFDQIDFVSAGDIFQVAAGAAFYGAGIGSGDTFTATADTTNDGIAVIEADGSGDETIDMSAAGGANGWTLIGAPDNAAGPATTLIGSDQDDVLIDGAADDADNNGEEDEFTGNAGEDRFLFNISTTTPATFALTQIQAALDLEYVTVLTATGGNAGTEIITVEYQLNNVTAVAVINDANAGFDVDFGSTTSIATAIAAVMNNIAGITAAVDGVTPTQVNMSGDTGNLLNINAITPNAGAGGGGTTFTNDARIDGAGLPADHVDDAVDTGNDDAQETDVTLSGTVSAGEIYFLSVALKDGSVIEAQYEAQPGDTLALVASGLLSNGDTSGFNQIAPAGTVLATSAGAVITLTDEAANDGGFTVTLSAGQAVLDGSSASSVLPSGPTGAETLGAQDADLLTDFSDDDDLISFGLAAGDSNNYDEGANAATFGAALLAANAAFAGDPDLIYFLTGSNADSVGLLFVNANGDDEADTFVQLAGVDASSFDDSNIV